MTENDILTNLPTDIEYSDVIVIVIDDSLSISVDDFMGKFNGIELIYQELIEHENCTVGWKSVFDDWKQQGILN